jgi:hypothetical protein
MYAQCEESFEKVERAYIEKLGRLSEVEGKAYLLQDLQTCGCFTIQPLPLPITTTARHG